MDRAYGPAVFAGGGGAFYAARPQSASYQASIRDPDIMSRFQPIIDRVLANQPRELFPGALAVANLIAGIGATLTGFGAIYAAGSALSENVERSQQGMALNIGGILSAAGGIIGGANFGQYTDIARLVGGATQIAGAALTPSAPAPVYASAPVYGAMPYNPPAVMPAQPVGAFAVPAAAAGRLAAIVAPILTKIAVKLGMRARPSLSRAMELVRKAAKLLQSPEAVAVALGITTAELATLITTSAARKRRHMNPANAKALRRAARRIKSFHRMCTHVDLLKTRRHSARSSGCFKCGKKKCAC